MRFLLPSLALLVAGAAAQTAADIPSCSLPCFVVAINASGCAITDYKCQCTTGMKTIQTDLTNCLLDTKPCNQTETIKIQPAANALCEAQAGVKVAAASSVASYGMGSVAFIAGIVTLMGVFGI